MRAQMRSRQSWGSALPLASAVLVGCIGDIGNAGDDPDNVPQSPTCSPTPDPIRRLTPGEYVNTVSELFPGVALPDQLPVPDERTDGFLGQAAGQASSALGVQRYQELATSIGEAAALDTSSWASCSDDSASCLKQIARELGFRAYRRPLDADEVTALETFAQTSYDQFGMQGGVALVVQSLLESPSFLYKPEVGVPGESIAPLDDYEMASRLSYLFLDSMPDAQLFAAAESGALSTDAGLEAEARRLLQDERARPVITGFFAEWLRLYKIDDLALDEATFPEYDEALRLDLEASVERYLDKAIWQDDSWQSLMTGNYGFVNDRLAPLFGVAAPGSDELVLVELDANERRGVLTQPGMLAATSHGVSHSPIYRGVTMLASILCKEMPAPPPGILDNLEEVELPPGEVCTVRDRLEKTHTVGSDCQGCHATIDGAGFAFENYDALGRFRTEENGCAVDASGSFGGTIGDVTGAVELADKLAESEVAQSCMATQLFRYATGRHEQPGDACQVDTLVEAMNASGGSLQETVIELVLSPAFRSRPSE
jgi:hypothetical protein